MTILCGLDYSINSPGLCIFDTQKELTFDNLKLYNINDKKKYTGVFGNITLDTIAPYNSQEERFRNTAQWAYDIISKNKVQFVTIEGYSMGSSAGLVFNIAENCSVIKQMLDLAKIPFDIPAPTAVKKFFTGKGNAKKELMVDTFEQKFGVDIAKNINQENKYSSPTNDLVDSVAMMMYNLNREF